jgi:hypothetical protein
MATAGSTTEGVEHPGRGGIAILCQGVDFAFLNGVQGFPHAPRLNQAL